MSEQIIHLYPSRALPRHMIIGKVSDDEVRVAIYPNLKLWSLQMVSWIVGSRARIERCSATGHPRLCVDRASFALTEAEAQTLVEELELEAPVEHYAHHGGASAEYLRECLKWETEA